MQINKKMIDENIFYKRIQKKEFIKIELYSHFFKKHLQLKNKFIDLLPNFDFNDKNYTNSELFFLLFLL